MTGVRAAIPNVLSIAGSDPSGGAGIQADLKTLGALGCHGMAVITALTVQNTCGVSAIHLPPAAFVGAQIEALFADSTIAAVKIGMLANAGIAAQVSASLARHRPAAVVLDPVLVATSGDSLGAPDVVDAIRQLLPQATLVTPNLAEAARLADMGAILTLADMRAAAERLHAMGARAALVKGGHLDGPSSDDVLFDGRTHHVLTAARIDTRNTHGTGCTLSSAIAAFLARDLVLEKAVEAAKDFLGAALRASARLAVGRGPGPVDHFHAWRG